MKAYQKLFQIVIILLLTSSFSLSSVNAQVPGPTVPPKDGSSGQLSPSQAGLPEDFHLERHSGTGMVRLLISKSGRALPQPGNLSADTSPVEAAHSFLDVYGKLFGLHESRQQLQVMRQLTLEDGRDFVRFQQLHQGIPILGAEMIVQLDQAKNVRSVQGEMLPESQLNLQPQINSEEAIQSALNLVARNYGYPIEALQSNQPELWVYDPLLLGAAGIPGSQLVWRMEISDIQALDVRELVLVNASLGQVALNFSQIDSLKSRLVYDNENNYTFGLPGYGPVRVEGDAASGIPDVDRAYEYAGNTYDFYSLYHLRDSIDNKGMDIVSTVRYCPDSLHCPLKNAYWNGSQMVYGDGYAMADDVVAHELTHGVTEHESRLFYYMQSGAISEAFSDIWGELVDQAYDGAYDNDDPVVRWLIAEDLPGGSVRNMSNPPVFNDPDKMTSSLYRCGTDDGGGVHHNNGVANKAAYLMVDGGTFNSYSITGIGTQKTIRLWYEVQTNLLTSAADYQDLNSALSLACTNLTGYYGITDSDCVEVRKALAAVEMDRLPSSCPALDVPKCNSITYNSNFFGSSNGWTPVTGTWATDTNYYYTQGAGSNKFASSALTALPIADMEFRALFLRQGTDSDANGLIIRGQPFPLDSYNHWYSGYGFNYTRQGTFAVFRYDQGTPISLQSWQYHPSILTGDSWNELKVIAQGAKLDFYINNVLVWTGKDSTYPSGLNGLSMYTGPDGIADLLRVDYAYISGGTPLSLLTDDFENPVRGLWYSSATIGKNVWRYPQTDIPDFFNISSTFEPSDSSSGAYNLWGFNISSRSDSNIAMLSDIYLPPASNAFMAFKHTYAFEGSSTYPYDGGVLEYSANGGAWTDAGSLIINNGYTGVLDKDDYSDNPLQGRSAFTYLSNGLITSRLNLASLAGKNVRFRYRVGTDTNQYQLGWFIDDVDIYTCVNQARYSYLPLVMTSNGLPVSNFHTNFNSSSEPWLPVSGNWTSTEKEYKGEVSISDLWGSIVYNGNNFDNFVYQVRMKRAGCDTCANQVMVRADPYPLASKNQWENGYSFSYSSSGYFSIFKQTGGIYSLIQDWTLHSAINTGQAWNVLKVIAIGSNLQFYINDTLVWSGSDSSFSTGKVGAGFYHAASAWDNLFIDWSQLSTISSLAFEQLEVIPGVIVPGGSIEKSPEH